MIYNISDIFKVKTNHTYPPHNNMIFEEHFYNYMVNNNIETDRYYLPIFWTNYYLSRGNGSGNMSDLQNMLNNLDRSEKYFTIIQYDDGILQDISGLDIKVYGSGGGGQRKVPSKNLGDVKIPLICKKNPNIDKNKKRDIFASFVGALHGRHKVRDTMYGVLNNNSKYILMGNSGYRTFSNIMERSLFSLCPRGYGGTSFRICESLQYGSIPVYIFDNPWIPWENEFDFNDIGILCHIDDIGNLHNKLSSKTEDDILKYVENGKRIYNEYFDFDGCSEKIIENINGMD